MAIPGITWVYMAIHGNTWLFMALHCYTWHYMAIHGITWLFWYISWYTLITLLKEPTLFLGSFGRMLPRENFWDWSSLRCDLVHSERLNLATARIPYWTCNAEIFNKLQVWLWSTTTSFICMTTQTHTVLQKLCLGIKITTQGNYVTLIIICHEHQNKLKYILWIVYW